MLREIESKLLEKCSALENQARKTQYPKGTLK